MSYGICFLKPGEKVFMNCPTCGERMRVQRNRVGPMTSIMVMAKTKAIHDYFECPHRHEQWHKQAGQIHDMVRRTPSAWFTAQLMKEAAEIVKTKKATRKPLFFH